MAKLPVLLQLESDIEAGENADSCQNVHDGRHFESILEKIADRMVVRRNRVADRKQERSAKRVWRDPVSPLMLVQLWRHWNMVLGDDLSAMTFPLGRRKDVLIVGGEDNSALQDILFRKRDILERVNAFFLDIPPETPVFAKLETHLLAAGQIPLSVMPSITIPEKVIQKTPLLTGKYLKEMSPDSPVTQCYKAFLHAAGVNLEDK